MFTMKCFYHVLSSPWYFLKPRDINLKVKFVWWIWHMGWANNSLVCVYRSCDSWREQSSPVRLTTCPLSLSQPLVKQDSLDTYNERDPFKNDDARDEEEDPEDTDSGIEGEVDPLDRDVIIQPPPPPPPLRPPTERVNFPKGLPWAPKVRLIAQFSFLRT